MSRDELTALRAALGCPSWDALAAQLGVFRGTVYRWLNGSSRVPGSVRVLIRLAQAGVNLKEQVQ